MTNSTLRNPLPDGPWTAEPDHDAFEHAGFPCILHRNAMGAWCGYVGVPPGHPWHRLHYDEVEAEVHGGLTYSDACQGDVCHVPKPGEPDDVWWVGFDCGHFMDIVPSLEAVRMQFGSLFRSDVAYRDQAYVTAETKRLADQALEAKP